MRFGYSFWGFLGDNKLDENGNELSTPDGNATYSWSIIHEATKRGWTVYQMQEDRDRHACKKHGPENFSAFNKFARWFAWSDLHATPMAFPKLDVLLLEWRFPIPGRNCFKVSMDDGVLFDGNEPQPDLRRQYDLLQYYKGTDTKIIIWDLDHKLEGWDELHWKPDAIFETSQTPRLLHQKRTKVEFPTVISQLLEHPTLPHDVNRKLVYVGSRYERDDVIEEYLRPVSDRIPGQIEFWGNWTKEPNLSECKAKWPNFSYNGRITTKKFRDVYGTAVACPLLAKRSYIETGFTTPRVWEALQFGTIPIGLSQMKGIEKYVLYHGKNWEEICGLVSQMSCLNLEERDEWRRDNIELIEHMDVKHFVNKIEEVSNAASSVF